MSAAAAKAVVVGPTAISAYSELSADGLASVPVTAWTTKSLAPGERNIELLWKAQKGAPAPLMLARR